MQHCSVRLGERICVIGKLSLSITSSKQIHKFVTQCLAHHPILQIMQNDDVLKINKEVVTSLYPSHRPPRQATATAVEPCYSILGGSGGTEPPQHRRILRTFNHYFRRPGGVLPPPDPPRKTSINEILATFTPRKPTHWHVVFHRGVPIYSQSM